MDKALCIAFIPTENNNQRCIQCGGVKKDHPMTMERPPRRAEDAYEKINHPKHYNDHPARVECIDIIEHMTFNAGTAMKHLWRAGLKPGSPTVEDLKKAAWYTNREIDRLAKMAGVAPRSEPLCANVTHGPNCCKPEPTPCGATRPGHAIPCTLWQGHAGAHVKRGRSLDVSIYFKMSRECEGVGCDARGDIEVEVGERDGQLTAKLEYAYPDDWDRVVVGAGRSREELVLCPVCKEKPEYK